MFRIMVPLDGSRFAEQALYHAIAIGRRTHAQLHLIRVQASFPLVQPDSESELYVKRVADQIRSQLDEPIMRWAPAHEITALHYPPPASPIVAELILRIAEEQDVDLIIMTTHGRGGIQRSWLGSVTDSLVRIAPLPLLIIRAEDRSETLPVTADRGFGHVLIPLDGSDTAASVIEVARTLGEPFDARYTLLRVVSPLAASPLPEPTESGTDRPQGSPLGPTAAMEYLEDVAGPMRADELNVDTRVVQDASPSRAVVEYAAEHAADVIAMSTSGFGGIRRLLLGSVFDKVMRSGDAPVLVRNVRQED